MLYKISIISCLSYFIKDETDVNERFSGIVHTILSVGIIRYRYASYYYLKKDRLYIHFRYTADLSYFSLFSNFCQSIVYVTEPPHKQFPAGFLQDFLDYIFPIQ